MRYKVKEKTDYLMPNQGLYWKILDTKDNKEYSVHQSGLENIHKEIDGDNINFKYYYVEELNEATFKIEDLIKLSKYPKEKYSFAITYDRYNQFNGDLKSKKLIFGRYEKHYVFMVNKVESVIKSSEDNYYICIFQNKDMINELAYVYENTDLDFFAIRTENIDNRYTDEYYVFENNILKNVSVTKGDKYNIIKRDNYFYTFNPLIRKSLKKIEAEDIDKFFILDINNGKEVFFSDNIGTLYFMSNEIIPPYKIKNISNVKEIIYDTRYNIYNFIGEFFIKRVRREHLDFYFEMNE